MQQTIQYSRRDFILTSLTAGTLYTLFPTLAGAAPDAKAEVWMLHGSDRKKLMDRAMEVIQAAGGLGPHASSMTLKVNAAWARTPEEGANTHPELVERFMQRSRESGIREITVPEHPCNSARQAFTRSGIRDAVKDADGDMIDLKSDTGSFREEHIGGKKLQQAEVAAEFLDTDVLVNMPVAKHHSGATLSMAMKNWMGAVRDRGFWHRNDLHQCIADFAAFIKPDWTIIDATRCMMDSGPQGPAQTLKTPNLLIVSKDQVAADVCASRLFHDSIDRIPHLVYAGENGAGINDLKRINVHEISI